MERMNGILAIGAMFVFASLMGFAIPVVNIQKTETVAKDGDLKFQSTEDKPHSIPKYLSGGLLALGLVFVGIGLYQKR